MLALNHVVITSVDRDDLRDGGAAHFAACIGAVRKRAPGTRIEVLVPDFRGRLAVALDILAAPPPDVLNHNLENRAALLSRGAAGCGLRAFARAAAGIQLGRLVLDEIRPHAGSGRTYDEVIEVMRDLMTTAWTCSPWVSTCNRARAICPYAAM